MAFPKELAICLVVPTKGLEGRLLSVAYTGAEGGQYAKAQSTPRSLKAAYNHSRVHPRLHLPFLALALAVLVSATVSLVLVLASSWTAVVTDAGTLMALTVLLSLRMTTSEARHAAMELLFAATELPE